MNDVLIRIGFWNNGIDDENYIWPQELVGKKYTDSKKICSYLSKGVKAIAWMGYSGCRICGITLGSHCLTDGTYLWPEKLEHYVGEHKVRLPEEFIEHVRKNEWKITEKGSFDTENYSPERDETFWKEWCLKNRDLKRSVGPGPEYPIPDETGDGQIEISLLDALFSSVERLDVVVSSIEVRSIEKDLSDSSLKKVLDKSTENSYHLWNARIKENEKLIGVYSDCYEACSVLKFDLGTPYFYCGNKKSMYVNVGVKKRYCPDLIKKNYEEIENE